MLQKFLSETGIYILNVVCATAILSTVPFKSVRRAVLNVRGYDIRSKQKSRVAVITYVEQKEKKRSDADRTVRNHIERTNHISMPNIRSRFPRSKSISAVTMTDRSRYPAQSISRR